MTPLYLVVFLFVSSIQAQDAVVIDYAGNKGFIPTLEDGSTADSYGNVY